MTADTNSKASKAWRWTGYLGRTYKVDMLWVRSAELHLVLWTKVQLGIIMFLTVLCLLLEKSKRLYLLPGKVLLSKDSLCRRWNEEKPTETRQNAIVCCIVNQKIKICTIFLLSCQEFERNSWIYYNELTKFDIVWKQTKSLKSLKFQTTRFPVTPKNK